MLLTLIFLCSSLLLASLAHAQVTVYNQIARGFAKKTGSSNAPAATALPAYNTTRLTPPAIHNPPPSSDFTLTLEQDAAVVSGLSMPHVEGCFWGFSIEMSVISQVRKFEILFFTPRLSLSLSLFLFFLSSDHFFYFSWQKLVCSS